MTINQAKILKNALYDVQLMELSYINMLPKYDIDNSEKIKSGIKEISEGFSKRKKQISSRFIVILAAAIISILLIVSISASDTIRGFFINIYQDFISITIRQEEDKEKTETPIQPFTASYMPEGYIKATTTNRPAKIQTKWDNGEHTITLTQSKPQNNDIRLDNEGDYQTLIVDEKTIYYMHKYNTYNILWYEANYLFTINCHDSVSLEEIKKIISSLEPVEEI